MNIINVRPFSNRLIEIAILAAVLVVFLIAMKLAYGQTADSLEELQSETSKQQSNRTDLINFINWSDIYANVTSLTPEEKIESKEKLNRELPSYSLEQLEELAGEVRNNGNPFEVIAEVEIEKYPPHSNCDINPNLC